MLEIIRYFWIAIGWLEMNIENYAKIIMRFDRRDGFYKSDGACV